jgi:hypothetical protein
LHSSAQTGFQRHHHRFAQRVNRRVGDLGELLAEIVIERAVPMGQYREGRIIAHGTNRFLSGFGQHPQDLIAFLKGYAEQFLRGA